MKLQKDLGQKITQYAKHYVLSKYDPTTLVMSFDPELEGWKLKHKGFYIGIVDSSGTQLVRVGFLEENCSNIVNSTNRVLEAVFAELTTKNISVKAIQTSTFYVTMVIDVVFMSNPLNWNENDDGVYFSWGDRYKGMYLPYEIKRLSVKKTEIMNRVCSWEASVPGNLWRLPEGLCSRLICDSYFCN